MHSFSIRSAFNAFVQSNNQSVRRLFVQRATPVQLDRFASLCQKWLEGGNAQLGRGAAQTLGIMAETEGARFGHRVPSLLPLLLSTLRMHSNQVWTTISQHSLGILCVPISPCGLLPMQSSSSFYEQVALLYSEGRFKVGRDCLKQLRMQ